MVNTFSKINTDNTLILYIKKKFQLQFILTNYVLSKKTSVSEYSIHYHEFNI